MNNPFFRIRHVHPACFYFKPGWYKLGPFLQNGFGFRGRRRCEMEFQTMAVAMLRNNWKLFQGYFQGPPIMGPLHGNPIRIPRDMGIVWETYHKGVPLLGVPENPTDYSGKSKSNKTTLQGTNISPTKAVLKMIFLFPLVGYVSFFLR